jgi:hypothetical protein
MAEEWVATARRLRHLPVLAATSEAGEIAMESVIEIARVATPETEEALVASKRFKMDL